MSQRRDLTDAEWKRLEPLLPSQKGKRGRPRNNDRAVINGILWIARTGAPWRDLPERYGSWKTVSSRFYRWQKAGVWQRIWEGIQAEQDAYGEIDWEVHFVDGTVVRAHQHAGGAKKGFPTQKR